MVSEECKQLGQAVALDMAKQYDGTATEGDREFGSWIAIIIPIVLEILQEACNDSPEELSEKARTPTAIRRIAVRAALRNASTRRDIRKMGGVKRISSALIRCAADEQCCQLMMRVYDQRDE